MLTMVLSGWCNINFFSFCVNKSFLITAIFGSYNYKKGFLKPLTAGGKSFTFLGFISFICDFKIPVISAPQRGDWDQPSPNKALHTPPYRVSVGDMAVSIVLVVTRLTLLEQKSGIWQITAWIPTFGVLALRVNSELAHRVNADCALVSQRPRPK